MTFLRLMLILKSEKLFDEIWFKSLILFIPCASSLFSFQYFAILCWYREWIYPKAHGYFALKVSPTPQPLHP